jgi:hypothetical protein
MAISFTGRTDKTLDQYLEKLLDSVAQRLSEGTFVGRWDGGIYGFNGAIPRKIRTNAEGVLKVDGLLDRLHAAFVDLPGSIVGPDAWLTMLNRVGRGTIEEIYVSSPDTNFKISVTVDGAEILSKTYDELRDIQQNSPTISAFAELDEDGDPTGYYIASIRGIPYVSSILLKVQNTGGAPVTFKQVFAKHYVGE